MAVATATPRWQYDQDTLLRMAGYSDHQRAGFFLVLPAQDGTQGFAVVVEGDVGDETQPPLVDAHERHALARHLPADAQQGAIATDDQRQLRVAADAGNVERGVIRQAGVLRRLLLQRHLAALRVQELGDLVDHVPRARRLVLAHDGHVGEAQGAFRGGCRGAGIQRGIHAQITSHGVAVFARFGRGGHGPPGLSLE